MQIADRVQFFGALEQHADVYGLIKSSGVFVLPSVREGFGIVVVEALACGVPVITTDHPDNQARLLIEHGVTGWLCAPSGAGLAEAIRESRRGLADLTRADETLGHVRLGSHRRPARRALRVGQPVESVPRPRRSPRHERWGRRDGHRTPARHRVPRRRGGSASPEISVVVCTYRRAEKLPACLDALARQTIRDRVEVIVVDDGPDDATAAVAARYDVRLVRHRARTAGSPRRATPGIEASTAPIVAFTDDDCVPAEDWLEAAAGAVRGPDVVAVGGRVEALRHETLVHRYLAETDRLAPLEIELSVSSSLAYRAQALPAAQPAHGGTLPGIRPVYSLVGANMSFRRDALVEIGMFDPRISFGGEDEDICRRLRERPMPGAASSSRRARSSRTTSTASCATLCAAATSTARGARAAT